MRILHTTSEISENENSGAAEERPADCGIKVRETGAPHVFGANGGRASGADCQGSVDHCARIVSPFLSPVVGHRSWLIDQLQRCPFTRTNRSEC